jgi:hypothetical protein
VVFRVFGKVKKVESIFAITLVRFGKFERVPIVEFTLLKSADTEVEPALPFSPLISSRKLAFKV